MKPTTILFLTASTLLFAAKHNAMLQYTMKAIGKDVQYASLPTTKETPGEVEDSEVLTAIARARTAAFQLQLVIDRKETEFQPPGVEDLQPKEKSEKLSTYSAYLSQAIEKLKVAEAQLQTEYKKSPPSRDFKPLAATFADLDKLIQDSHKVFKPEE